MAKKTHSLRFTSDQWTALRAKATLRGYSGPNAMMQAIADGDLPIGAALPQLNTYVERLIKMEGEISGLRSTIEELRCTKIKNKTS